MSLGLLLLLATGVQPVCAPRTAALVCPAPRQAPPTAATCSRPLRTGLAGHRIKRDPGGPPIFFHFEPQLTRSGAVRPLRHRPALPATRPGISRAPPLTTMA